MTAESKTAYRRKMRRLSQAKASAFGRAGSLPVTTERESDVPALTPSEMAHVDALYAEWLDGLPAESLWGWVARRHSTIPERHDRRRSYEDRHGGRVRDQVIEVDGDELEVSPFEEAAYGAWRDDLHVRLPESAASLIRAARSAPYVRARLANGRGLGSDAHLGLLDAELSAREGGPFAEQLARLLDAEGPLSREAEARALGVSPRTWRRRRAAMREAAAA